MNNSWGMNSINNISWDSKVKLVDVERFLSSKYVKLPFITMY